MEELSRLSDAGGFDINCSKESVCSSIHSLIFRVTRILDPQGKTLLNALSRLQKLTPIWLCACCLVSISCPSFTFNVQIARKGVICSMYSFFEFHSEVDSKTRVWMESVLGGCLVFWIGWSLIMRFWFDELGNVSALIRGANVIGYPVLTEDLLSYSSCSGLHMQSSLETISRVKAPLS